MFHGPDVACSGRFDYSEAKRWRVWPNPGFVLQLLSYERYERGSQEAADAADAADAESEALLEMVGIRSAWAANQQNLQETGFGRKDITMEQVASFWKRLAASLVRFFSFLVPQKIAPAREPKQCGGGEEVNIPDTSNSSYGTATDEVRHYSNCSSRTFYIDL